MKEMLNGQYIRGDYREYLPDFPDKHFDIAIIDWPYFLGPDSRGYYGQKKSSRGVKRVDYEKMDWSGQIPTNEDYQEVVRVSNHQIIWGINYFEFDNVPPGRIIWDKCNQSSSFSDCEIASCSFHDSTRMFRFMWNGMMQGKSITEGHIMQGNKKLNEKRIHPTQKPVALYKWLAMKYCKPGFKILDTCVGSASSLIAYEDAGLDYVGYEINEKHYQLSLDRVTTHLSQLTLF